MATNATTCTLASSPAAWQGPNPITVSCNGSYQGQLSPTSSQITFTFTFTATNSSGVTATDGRTITEQAPQFQQSPNWSGYFLPSSSSLITEVGGSWTVPALNCSRTPNAGAGIWVGIGGVPWATGGTSGALLQTGISADCVNGVQQDHGWWELYPSTPNYAADFAGFTVSPGDSIQASVFQGSSGVWETRVDDLSTGLSGVMVTGAGWGVLNDGGTNFPLQGKTTNLSYSGGYTAEWIVEAYQQNGSQVSLADYGTVTVTNLTTSLSSWSLTSGVGEAIVESGVVVSTPSPPENGGFSVSYTGP
jgi:hypothetical protein